jgi:hypothetical protein
MTLREMMAHLRLFFAFFLALIGLGIVLHSADDMRLFVGAVVGAAGFTSLFLIWLAARTGEK